MPTRRRTRRETLLAVSPCGCSAPRGESAPTQRAHCSAQAVPMYGMPTKVPMQCPHSAPYGAHAVPTQCPHSAHTTVPKGRAAACRVRAALCRGEGHTAQHQCALPIALKQHRRIGHLHVQGARCGVRGAECRVHGAWGMGHGAWCTVHGARCTVHGARYTVHGGCMCPVFSVSCLCCEPPSSSSVPPPSAVSVADEQSGGVQSSTEMCGRDHVHVRSEST